LILVQWQEAAMDDRQRDVLHLAIREAYLCLRDRNRPQVMVEGRLVHSDADLANTIRLFEHRLLTAQAERDRLMREMQPLWEAQVSGALERLLDAVGQLQEAEVGHWRAHVYGDAPSAVLHDSDLQILRALAGIRERDHWGR
jgi:hypothetical protein